MLGMSHLGRAGCLRRRLCWRCSAQGHRAAPGTGQAAPLLWPTGCPRSSPWGRIHHCSVQHSLPSLIDRGQIILEISLLPGIILGISLLAGYGKACSWKFLSNSNEPPNPKLAVSSNDLFHKHEQKGVCSGKTATHVLSYSRVGFSRRVPNPVCLNTMKVGKVRGRSPARRKRVRAGTAAAVLRGVCGAGPAGLGDPIAVPQLLRALSPSSLAVLWYAAVFCLASVATGIGKDTWKRQHHFRVTSSLSGHCFAGYSCHSFAFAKYCPSSWSVPLYFQGMVIRAPR